MAGDPTGGANVSVPINAATRRIATLAMCAGVGFSGFGIPGIGHLITVPLASVVAGGVVAQVLSMTIYNIQR